MTALTVNHETADDVKRHARQYRPKWRVETEGQAKNFTGWYEAADLIHSLILWAGNSVRLFRDGQIRASYVVVAVTAEGKPVLGRNLIGDAE